MPVSRLRTALLFLLLTFLSATITTRADDEEPDDYDVKARVVRVSLMIGEVNLKRNGSKEWELVRLNYPLVEGDTVATGKDSRTEIQFDSRTFVRLAPGSVLRIVTLRDEATALSVVEGAVTVRVGKFESGRESFEIEAPRTTLTIEKTGFYRIDVPREGRVRLTVRDGGLARIQSDTSGFLLRDGRSAELIVAGPNAGDWNLLAAAPADEVDEWVSERERYLAQRFRYDDKYFDEYVWGAEDLGNYGEWTKTGEYGWIWRPHATVINAFSDWAPYRYGHWTWCPPYGWTWVGYEPWGWAPYHYGRWVFYNNAWAWVPRSHFSRKRSWWRPALVAFVNFSFSFGDNICWYPLSYYQRDPHSRHYRRYHPNNDRGGRDGGGGRYAGGGRERDGRNGGGERDGNGRDGDGRERRYSREAEYKSWQGVTRVPRTRFGYEPGRPVDETAGRRVIESAPEVENLPRRVGLAGSIPAADGNPSDGRVRRPVPEVLERPTGAATREPVYGGRTIESSPQPPVERRPEPPVERRPEPPVERRPEPPVERRPEPSVERRPEPSVERRPEPRVERRPEPRLEPRIERRSEPRSENPRSNPPPRSDPPARSEPPPRNDPPPRSDPPARSEPPPRNDPPPRSDPPARSEPPPRNDPPPRAEPPRSESPRSDPGPKRPDNLRGGFDS